MSEKRDPRSFLVSVLVQSGYSHSTAGEMVQRALDVHAHELAQKIRALDWNDAADLIDPGDAA